ncbi:MAG TPA: tRNA (adenosine(37)-N6)-dimethylallyltransferase MiaA [Chitinophagaceae bacterium]
MNHPHTVIIIVGATAVGKTDFAIQAARLLDTAIISADSRQCYRELNIGVAKPSAEQLESIRHYFINSHSIQDEVNAMVFESFALRAAEEIFLRRNVAVIAGGTGLYVKAFCEGLDEIPAVDQQIRQEVTGSYDRYGLSWLQEQVKTKDPVFWETAEQQNPQRLMRALEVILSSGQSITGFRSGGRQPRAFNIIKVGLDLPRNLIYERINRRVDQMMERGLEAEARALFPFRHLNALQTVGYQELFEYFEGKCTLHSAIENIKTNTRRYAKRQLTWFRKDKDVRWFPAGTPAEKVIAQVFKH